MKYNWQRSEWPGFRYRLVPLEADLYAFAEKSGHVGGMLKALPEKGQTQAILDVMIAEAIKTSEIEGEYLSRPAAPTMGTDPAGVEKSKIPPSEVCLLLNSFGWVCSS